MTTTGLIKIVRKFARDIDQLRWNTPSHVYNPLVYAWSAHREYLQRYGAVRGRVLLLGMNPGPWGMAQTGVPFGDVAMVDPFHHLIGAVRLLAEPREQVAQTLAVVVEQIGPGRRHDLASLPRAEFDV